MLLARRTLLLGAMALVPVAHARPSFALDALPDARFVGFAQQVNDFEIASGRLALSKSMNEMVRGFATRTVAEHARAAEDLAKARAEAGVSFAPDPNGPPHTAAIIQRLNLLDGPDFDAEYSRAQLRILSEAEQQYAANSATPSNNSGSAFSGAIVRWAGRELPHIKAHREMALVLAGAR
ncbi:MAG: DUF4142 domain-containing protein [Alphaproteobacteria bacterium]|nr:DUF4142 domain-containing protein [Alphaproteobacteria bacterium]